MEMTPNEIRASYKAAKYPDDQVKILADLNETTEDEIISVLGGEYNPFAKRRPGRPTKKIEKELPSGNAGVPEVVMSLVIARMETLEKIIQGYEAEYKQLAEFIKGGK